MQQPEFQSSCRYYPGKATARKSSSQTAQGGETLMEPFHADNEDSEIWNEHELELLKILVELARIIHEVGEKTLEYGHHESGAQTLR
jgi:hypothetical protein